MSLSLIQRTWDCQFDFDSFLDFVSLSLFPNTFGSNAPDNRREVPKLPARAFLRWFGREERVARTVFFRGFRDRSGTSLKSFVFFFLVSLCVLMSLHIYIYVYIQNSESISQTVRHSMPTLTPFSGRPKTIEHDGPTGPVATVCGSQRNITWKSCSCTAVVLVGICKAIDALGWSLCNVAQSWPEERGKISLGVLSKKKNKHFANQAWTWSKIYVDQPQQEVGSYICPHLSGEGC